MRVLHRVVSVLSWTVCLALAAFGTLFSFANYPALAIAVTLAALGLLGYSERNRRLRQKASERARRRARHSEARGPSD